jgi:phosphoenolpyruvate carboxykinase (ATP)
MDIAHTRAIIHAILDGSLRQVPTHHDALFNLAVPVTCPNVPTLILNPRKTWVDPVAYDAQAIKVSEMFHHNFKRFDGQVSPEIAAAGPHMGELWRNYWPTTSPWLGESRP